MRDQRGFALIAALWLVVAISAVSLQLSLSARQRRLGAANTLEYLRARGAADAGVEHARERLEQLLRTGTASGTRIRVTTEPSDPWNRPGILFPDTVRLALSQYRVVLRDVGTALNLNRASEDEIRNLLAALRMDIGDADRLAQAIADWRDPDDEHRGRGAERDFYEESSSPVLPRNGPFQELGELRFVRGVDQGLYETIRPYFTLLGTGRVNLNAAEPEVILALEGMSNEAVAVVGRFRRQRRPLSSLAQLARELSPPARRAIEVNLIRLQSRVTFDTREVEVMSEGWGDGSIVHARVQGLLVRAGNSAFLVWSRVA